MIQTTQPVNFIRFHGFTLLVVAHDGIEYIEARPLCEVIGLNWRRARDTVQSGDNATLYGTCSLTPPQFGNFEAPRGIENTSGEGGQDDEETEIPAIRSSLHIRLDRSRMFLARINTNQMRAQGNESAADLLLALQIEWAAALHIYETDGVAIKKGHRENRSDLLGLIKARNTTTNVGERAALTAMIADACAALGYPLPADPQQQLNLS